MLSSIRPSFYSFSPEKIPETSQGLEIRAVSPALSYPPFILPSLRNFYSFPVPSGFFQKLPLSPLPRPNILFLSSHPKPIRRSVPVPAPAPAQNRCRSYKRRLFQSLPLAVPPRLFLFPFPASAGSQADGKWPFFASQVPVCSLFTPTLRRNSAPFVPFLRSKRPGFPDRTLQPAKAPHPFPTAWKSFHSSPKSQLFLFSPAKLRKT